MLARGQVQWMRRSTEVDPACPLPPVGQPTAQAASDESSATACAIGTAVQAAARRAAALGAAYWSARHQDSVAPCCGCDKGVCTRRSPDGSGFPCALPRGTASTHSHALDDVQQSRGCQTRAPAAGSCSPSLAAHGAAMHSGGHCALGADNCSCHRISRRRRQDSASNTSDARKQRTRRARCSALMLLSIAVLASLVGGAAATEINTAVSIFGPWDYELRQDGTSRYCRWSRGRSRFLIRVDGVAGALCIQRLWSNRSML